MSFTVDYTIARADIRLLGKLGVVVDLTGTDLGADAVRVTVDKESAASGNRTVMTKEEFLLGLDCIRQKVMEQDWPPTTDA